MNKKNLFTYYFYEFKFSLIIKPYWGDLPIGDTESYTSDSTGQEIAEIR